MKNGTSKDYMSKIVNSPKFNIDRKRLKFLSEMRKSLTVSSIKVAPENDQYDENDPNTFSQAHNGGLSIMRQRRQRKFANLGVSGILTKLELKHYTSIHLYHPGRDVDIDSMFTIETLFDLSRYEWFRTGGFCSKWRGFFIPTFVLDTDTEEIGLMLDLFEKAIEAETFRLSDWHSLCFTKEHTRHKLCDGMVAWVEQSWMIPEHFLDSKRLRTFQTFCSDILEACLKLKTNVNGKGECILPPKYDCDEPVEIAWLFESKETLRHAYDGIFGKMYKHLPAPITKPLVVSWLDPFGPLEDIHSDDKVWVYPALLMWGLFAYRYAANMCLTSENMFEGLAKSDKQGDAMMRYFADCGVDIAQTKYPQRRRCAYFGGTIDFDTQESGSEKKSHSLPSILTLRRSNVSEEIIDDFTGIFMDYLGACAQDCIAARYYVISLPARRELAYIAEIKRIQERLTNECIALFMTLGITLGNSLSPIITKWWLGE